MATENKEIFNAVNVRIKPVLTETKVGGTTGLHYKESCDVIHSLSVL